MNKTKRIKYNTPINFPASFTLRELRKTNHNKMKYITLYSRVQKALEDGVIVEAGLKDPTKSRRGRKEFVYQLVAAEPSTTVNITPITDGVGVNNPF
jgi:hypothetical protein